MSADLKNSPPPTPPPDNSAISLTESDEDMVSYPTPGSVRGEIRYPTPEGLKEGQCILS